MVPPPLLPRCFSACALLLVGLSVSRLEAGSGGLNAPVSVAPFLNGAFPAVDPGQPADWATENAFPNLTFVDPLWLTPIPGGNDLLLVGKNGQIWRFDNNLNTTQAQVVNVLDLTTKIQTSEDQGLYSLIFHPQFGQGGPNSKYAYLCYNFKPNLAGADPNNSYWRVSRFTWVPTTGKLDPASEYVLMHQYDCCRWHNGGGMFFDNAGFLNIACGDGGTSDEGGGVPAALTRSQRLNQGLFGGIFRIDVNNDPTKSRPILRQPQDAANKPLGWPTSYTQGYQIPLDNPWAHLGSAALGEYAGLGLRSPHTAHYDAVTGDVWIGDVGQKTREELTRLQFGGNAQWGYREGFAAGPGDPAIPPLGVDTPPLIDYDRTVGSAIIGGMRYRGSKWNAALGGKVLYGDHVRGKIWAATLHPGALAPTIEIMVDGFKVGRKAGLANFCTDASGEIYLMNLNGTNQPGGTIQKLVLSGASEEPPHLLSQTGFFTNLATLEAISAAIPYSVAAPLWSDASAKKRWIVLPNDGTHNTPAEDIVFNEDEPWLFPAGTVMVKHFEISTHENDPSKMKRLETRFLVCTVGGGKYGVTYRWNSEGTDAVLLTTGQREDFNVTLQNGSTVTRRWDYPSRADCMQCHNAASGQALGLRTSPLNKDYFYQSTGRTANQLATFNALGMFDRTLTSTELENFIESRGIDDAAAPVEHRVRSYLDMNCAHCHRPNGTVNFFDLRIETPLNLQGFVDETIKGEFDIGPNDRYLKPGDPSLSALHVRLMNAGNGIAMPPLAKALVDSAAVNLLEQYITNLKPTEFETTPSPQARYVKLTALSGVLAQPWTAVAEFEVLDGRGLPIPAASVSIHDFDSEELMDPLGPATHAIDGNPDTIWHTKFGSPVSNPPHHLTLDLGSLRSVGGFVYTPRQASADGRIRSYQVHHSIDGVNWTLMNSGVWQNDAIAKRYDGQVGKRKARCEISGPSGVVSSAFDVTVTFDMEVTDFTATDLQVTGGTVAGLRGKGYYYVARILPHAPDVTVSVPADVANGAALGNRASATLALDFLDTLPPVPVFTEGPPNVTGPFQIRISFGEPVTGLTASDLVLTNATLGSLTPSGDHFLLNLIPQIAGSPVSIEILSGAVTDLGGLAMGAGIAVTIPSILQRLTLNADEASYIGGGMTLVTDPTAPGGKYLWLPNATGSHLILNTLHRVEYTFVVPHAGDWVLRGLTRAPDGNSNSFHVEVDGNQGLGTVIFWDIPLNTTYTWDDMGNPTAGDPVLLNLTAGSHTITLYARDDGTRLSQLELQSLRPLATLTTPESTVTGSFAATLTFSENVTGLAMADFSVTGGSITSLTGSGSAFSLTILPTAASVDFSLLPNTVVDSVGTGNFGSNALTVAYRGSPPIPTFTGVPANVTGPFQITLSFDKPVVGLTASDLVLVNARLDSVVPAGDDYLLSITPLIPGSAAEIQILSAAVTNLWGQAMGAGASISIPYVQDTLTRNASEASYIGGAMRLVTDASAPHGHYLWLPQNQLAGNALVPNNRAEFTFIVPHTGEWKLRGLLRAVNGTSDSFYVEVDGNQGLGSVFAWHFNEIVGTTYAWDFMGNYGVVDPVILNLTAGSHTITVYAREDGSQLDRLELVSVRPSASLNTTAGVVSGPFEATLTFSEAVTGLTEGDISITGGSVTSVTGSGSSYTLAISPTAESVIFSLLQDSVINAAGARNIASNPLGVTYRTLYQRWVSDHLLTGMNAAQLADDDHDGTCNLLEFAFNLNPAASDTKVLDLELSQIAGLPRMIVIPGDPSGERLSLQYLRRKGFTGLTYQVQFGSSLTDFADSSGIPLVEDINSNWQRVTVTDLGEDGVDCRFGRVVVTSQSP
jgi:uncharacterized repeat protein (TIGR03806 family)